MRQPQPNTGQVPIAVIVNPAPARQAQAPLAAQPGPGQQGMSRLQETLGGIPPATLFFLALNIGVFIGTGLWTFNLGSVSISSYYVLYKLELYRMISAAFFHMGLLHIGMNMMSLFFMGPHLERTYGTVQFFIITWIFVILDGVLYVAISAGLAFVVFRDMKWYAVTAACCWHCQLECGPALLLIVFSFMQAS